MDDQKLLEKYRAVWAKIEDLEKIRLNALPVYDDRYIKIKIRTYCYEFYTKFRGINMPEDDIECESFTVISIDSLLVQDSKYCQEIKDLLYDKSHVYFY